MIIPGISFMYCDDITPLSIHFLHLIILFLAPCYHSLFRHLPHRLHAFCHGATFGMSLAGDSGREEGSVAVLWKEALADIFSAIRRVTLVPQLPPRLRQHPRL